MFRTVVLSLVLASSAFAYDACVTAETALQLAQLSDGPDRRANVRPIQQLLGALCSPGGRKGMTVYYENGQLATIALGNPNFGWNYPNGQSATAISGNGNIAFYYPSGRTFSSLPGNRSIAWTYPNGQTFSAIPGNTSVAWLWSNGTVLAQVPGLEVLPWYHRNGTTAFSRAPFKVTDQDMETRPHGVLKQLRKKYKGLAR